MLINQTVTKKILESIVHETFITFGSLSSSALLDALKFLGFYYATNAGISINIEDLKTPDIKSTFLLNANHETQLVSTKWKNGLVSDNERFQSIIDSWNIATESLKNRIVDYYQEFDPVNNLYIMAFSGARGNMSQVRQLVGMRGLMSDQEGKIIDLPIQTNFREGLSSIDYIISSYGARKGIVDTALKTADSGYLTRRLIYVAQDLVIREFNCKTQSGLIILLTNKTSGQNFIGRSVLSIKKMTFPFEELLEQEKILDPNMFRSVQELAPVSMNLRSSLTCESNGSVCQMCYGWDLAHKKLISLGEVIGILAAQSIGEPGTQLTMRTFHTGGIFTSETLKQVVAPFSGKLIIPDSLKSISLRTNHGIRVLKLQQEINLQLINWKGSEETISLQIGSFLYLQKSDFLQKGQLIAEYSTQAILPGPRKSKPIYTPFSGEVKFENIILKKKIDEKKRVTKNEGVVWVTAGTIFQLPKAIYFKYPKKLEKEKAFAKLKIITPIHGIVSLENNTLMVTNSEEKRILNISNLLFELTNCNVKIIPILKNYQYVDSHTIVAYVYIFPLEEGTVFTIREQKLKSYGRSIFKEEQLNTVSSHILIIRDTDTWEINCDQVNNFLFGKEKKMFVRANTTINSTSLFRHSGVFLKKDGLKLIFQHALPIFLSPNSALYAISGDFVEKKQLLATLIKYTQQTEDIVQGLPKIEELIEARKPRNACELAKQPGVICRPLETVKITPYGDCLRILVRGVDKIKEQKEREEKKAKKTKKAKKPDSTQTYYIVTKLDTKLQTVTFKSSLYSTKFLPSEIVNYAPYYNDEVDEEYSISDLEKNLRKNKIIKKKKREKWRRVKTFAKEDDIKNMRKVENGEEKPWPPLNQEKLNANENFPYSTYKKEKAKDKDKELFILKIYEKSFLLKPASLIEEYQVPLKTQFRYEPGVFIDLGEPINDGMIDTHQLLKILFQYHSKLDGILKGTLRSLTKFQLLLVNSIQAIYQSQGVNISSKHIEIIVRQMTSKVVIVKSGDTPFLPGELISLSLITELCHSLQSSNQSLSCTYQPPQYEPKLRSATNSSLTKDGFLSAAGFQETRRVLTRAAIAGNNDWLRGLKESLITGRIIPAGSAFLNYKNYLNNIYSLKN